MHVYRFILTLGRNLQGRQTAEMRVFQGNLSQLTECVFSGKRATYTWNTQLTHVTVTTGQLSTIRKLHKYE
jgi:hypothetical protein